MAALETNQQEDDNLGKSKLVVPDTLHGCLFQNLTEDDGSRTCLIDGITGNRFTYNEVELTARRVASGLNKLGIQRGDGIMVMLENSPEFVFTFLGASFLGAVTVLVDYVFKPDENARQAKDFNVKLLVTEARFYKEVRDLNVTLVFIDSAPEGHMHFSKLAEANENEMPEVNVNPDDVAWLYCSSATEEMLNLPQSVIKFSHKELVTQAKEATGHFPQCLINNEDVIWFDMPLFAIFPCIWFLLCGMMAKAAILLIPLSVYDDVVNELLDLVEKCKVTFMPIVQALALFIAKSPDCGNYDLSSVKVLYLLTYTGDRLGKELEDTLRARFPEARLAQKQLFNDSTNVSTLPDKDILVEVAVFHHEIRYGSTVWNMITSTQDGLRSGNYPLITKEGTSGAYFMYDSKGNKYVSIFKPLDEEAGAAKNPRPRKLRLEDLKKGITVSQGAFMEVVAYILDHPKGWLRCWLDDDKGFAGVPPTILAKCLHKGFNHPEGEVTAKIGSLQMFIENDGSCADWGYSKFRVEQVHKITVLDMRLANADRHGGNILYRKDQDKENGQGVLIPIDHGSCLPTTFEDCTFEWLWWRQARERYSTEITEYIKSLNAEDDIELLKLHGWELPVERARTLRISTMLLKKGVEKGMTPYAIGMFMSRKNPGKEPESEIERIIKEVRRSIPAGAEEDTLLAAISNALDWRLNEISSASLPVEFESCKL